MGASPIQGHPVRGSHRAPGGQVHPPAFPREMQGDFTPDCHNPGERIRRLSGSHQSGAAPVGSNAPDWAKPRDRRQSLHGAWGTAKPTRGIRPSGPGSDSSWQPEGIGLRTARTGAGEKRLPTGGHPDDPSGPPDRLHQPDSLGPLRAAPGCTAGISRGDKPPKNRAARDRCRTRPGGSPGKLGQGPTYTPPLSKRGGGGQTGQNSRRAKQRPGGRRDHRQVEGLLPITDWDRGKALKHGDRTGHRAQPPFLTGRADHGAVKTGGLKCL